MDETRRETEGREEQLLPPWALRSARAQRGRPLDPEGRLFDYRTEYQRDRDRILHARSFRRLRQKTDGGSTTAVDPRRDRLTRTLEVAQIARTMARALGLNEDLAEAIALGHDLGCPPFGATGAEVLSGLLSRGRSRLEGGFHTGCQSLRIVDLLEKRYAHDGLNLTHDVREGIFKQPGSPSPPRGGSGRAAAGGILSGIDLASLRPGRSAPLEAQAVAMADQIASTLGRMDDALRAGEVEPADLERLPITRELLRRVGSRYPSRARGRLTEKANLLHRGLTHMLVTAAIQASLPRIRAWCRARKIEDHEGFLAHRDDLPGDSIAPAARISRLLESLGESLRARLGAGAAAAQAAARARGVIGTLFDLYRGDPRLLDDYVLFRFRDAAGGAFLRDLAPAAMDAEITRRYHGSRVMLRLIADHIAGMTDAYARFERDRLAGTTPGTAVEILRPKGAE